MDLGAVLDQLLRRRASGDIEALLWLWQAVAPETLTRTYVEETAPRLLERLGTTGRDAADATRLALALALDARPEVEDIARDYHDQDSALIRAILDQSVPS